MDFEGVEDVDLNMLSSGSVELPSEETAPLFLDDSLRGFESDGMESLTWEE